MPSDTPRTDPTDRSVGEQLRTLGRQLDEAAPPVEPSELAEATPTAEVAHLVAVDPDATKVIPLVPVPPMAADVPPRRRRRGLAVAAAALAVVAAGGAAAALAGDDDEVRTDQAAELRPVSEPAQDPAEEPPVDLGGFGDVAEAFATCMDGAGFSVGEPGAEGFEDFGSFEELAALVADPAFFDAMRECTASSGMADLDLGAELEELDLDGTFEDELGQLGGGLDEMFQEALDDMLAEVEGIDMAEVTAQLDAWLAEMEVRMAEGDLRERIEEEGARADRVLACMQDRGWAPESFEGEVDQTDDLLADLQECTAEG